MSLVTVVIPAYNAGKFISETLRSVMKQSHAKLECVIVDDGSTDTTAEIAQHFVSCDERFRLMSQQNMGVAAARNLGLSASSGEYLLFLDADDVLTPSALAILMGALKSAPELPAAHGQATVISPDGKVSDFEGYEQKYGRLSVRPGRWPFRMIPAVDPVGRGHPTDEGALFLRNPITTTGQVLIKKSALDTIGGFDTKYQLAEDWNMWLRLVQFGPIVHVEAPVIHYRKHPGGASSSLPKMRAAELRVRRAAIASNEFNSLSRRLARLGLRYYECERAVERWSSALRHLQRRELRETMKDVLRLGSSIAYVVLSLLPEALLRSLSKSGVNRPGFVGGSNS